MVFFAGEWPGRVPRAVYLNLENKSLGTPLALSGAMDSKKKSLLKMTGLTCLSLATAFAALSSEDLKRSFENLRSEEAHPAIVVNPEGDAGNEGFIGSLSPSRLIEETLTPPPLKNFENEPVTFDRAAILADHEARISELFHIPEALRDRVGFWFDIYTKHDSNRRVIHHAMYPWIIFKVIDVSSIINSDQPSRRWMRNEKADKYVKSETAEIRAALRRLSKRGREPQTDLEKHLAQALAPLGGSLSVQAHRALKEVRVQTGQKEHFTEGLRVSQRYLRPMEQILESHRLPTELSRIPFVESSFNKQATSKVGASGIWQFMGNTGRKFMRVDDLIDERRSPFKATEGAARLLKENHMILHRSWPLAITAWNHGPPGVRRAIRATGSKDLSVIVSKYRSKSFDFASSNFYSEFLAALHAEKYSSEIFGSLLREDEISVAIVKIPRRTPMAKIVEISGLSMEEFLRINPDLSSSLQKRGIIPAGFRLHIPSDSKEAVEKLLVLRPVIARAGSLEN